MSERRIEASGIVPVVAAIVRQSGRVLLAQRPQHKRHGLMWEFPGGKLRPGESVHDALRRELREELGIEVTRVGSIRGTFRDPGSEFEIHFVDVEITGTPRAIEHLALRWARLEKLGKLSLAPADRQFADAYLRQAGRALPGRG